MPMLYTRTMIFAHQDTVHDSFTISMLHFFSTPFVALLIVMIAVGFIIIAAAKMLNKEIIKEEIESDEDQTSDSL